MILLDDIKSQTLPPRALTARKLLLTGPVGTGKTTAAKALAARAMGVEEEVTAANKIAGYGEDPKIMSLLFPFDFFHVNGSPIGGTSDALIRVARAGRERGTAGLYCTQRARSIPSSIIEELSQLYLFTLDGRSDLKRCVEMGAPEWIEPPEREYEFMLWTKRHRKQVFGPFRVDL